MPLIEPMEREPLLYTTPRRVTHRRPPGHPGRTPASHAKYSRAAAHRAPSGVPSRAHSRQSLADLSESDNEDFSILPTPQRSLIHTALVSQENSQKDLDLGLYSGRDTRVKGGGTQSSLPSLANSRGGSRRGGQWPGTSLGLRVNLDHPAEAAADVLRSALKAGDGAALTPKAATPRLFAGTRSEAELSAMVSQRKAERRRLADELDRRAQGLADEGPRETPSRARQTARRRLLLGEELAPAPTLPTPMGFVRPDSREALTCAPVLKTDLDRDARQMAEWAAEAAAGAFSMYDLGKGWLSEEEVRSAAAVVLGRDPSFSEVSSLLRKCPGGTVPRKDFIRHLVQRVMATDPTARARRMFECFDDDRNGSLDLAEAARAFRQLVPNVSDVMARAMFKSADVNGDGVVSLDEFLHYTVPRLARGSAVTSTSLSARTSQRDVSAWQSPLSSAVASLRASRAASRAASRRVSQAEPGDPRAHMY